ncbi:MAG: RNA polymerase sigma factor [Anaerolineae bacterium]|nr:RNA polymerase sigma factor [Anaerolineae bacterium]
MLRFETLIDRYHDEIYLYIWRMLSGSRQIDASQEAQDLTQEVFIRAYRAFGRLRADSNHRAWLYRIARNCVYSASKWNSRHPTADLGDEQSPGDHGREVEQGLIDGELVETVGEMINHLPPQQYSALVMRYLQELDYETIGEILSCSPESARANVYQALRRLRLILVEEDD